MRTARGSHKGPAERRGIYQAATFELRMKHDESRKCRRRREGESLPCPLTGMSDRRALRLGDVLDGGSEPASYASVTPDRNVPVLKEEIALHSLDCSCDFRFLVDYRVQPIGRGEKRTGISYDDGCVR